MSRDYVQYFNHLTVTLLTEKERDQLYKNLRQYQRSGDVVKLAKSVRQLLDTPERTKLLAYIRAPMSKGERNRFDELLGIQGLGSINMASPHMQGYIHRMATPPGSVHSTPTERHVTITGSRGGSMGFSIRGGSEFGLGIYVSNMRPGSPAATAGLQVGDQIVLANGVDFHCIANSSAVKVLSSSALLNLVVIRCGKVPEWKVAREKVLWYDVALCRVVGSPPVSEIPTPSGQPNPNVLVERKVVITISQESDFIGLNIRGGREYGIGVYVSRVDPGGLAEKVGLSSGDQIVKVNDTDCISITHSDAVDALRSSTHLIIVIRSVGKYPVYKELYAEYTWSGVGGGASYATSSVKGYSRVVTVPGETGKHTQRARTRESSIDLTPQTHLVASTSSHIPDTELDEAIEELDDCLEVESRLCYPGDKDIMFRRDYEDSWQRIDTLNDNYARPDELTSSWSVDHNNSLSHRRQDSDLSDNMDYTTFLEQSALKELQEQQSQKSQTSTSHDHIHDNGNVVIETTVEEGVTSFSSNPHGSVSSYYNNNNAGVVKDEIFREDQVYAQVTNLTGKTRNGSQSDSMSKVFSNKPAMPIYASVNKTRGNNSRTPSVKSKRAPEVPQNIETNGVNGIDDNHDDNDDLEVLSSQIKRLEARKSNLGSWEITRVAGGTPKGTSPGSSEKSEDTYDKQKMGTWNTLKKKLKGSLRIGTGKKRSSLPTADAFAGNSPSPTSPTGSLQQKGMFERSFGSQILNTPNSERYNLMGMLEDHARILLTEDECKAVLRHIHNYHENKQLDRLVDLLLAILDQDDKKLLLVDIRNVIAPAHIERFDELIEHCNIQGYDHWVSKFNMQDDVTDSPAHTAPIKPARTKNGVNSKKKTGSYDLINNDFNSRSQIPQFSKEDFENMPNQLEVVIVEDEDVTNRDSPVVEDGEEIVYISKHKIYLGMEICGGRHDAVDQTIRVKQIRPGGAASDDARLKPGIEITKVDGTSVLGMSREEVESLLQTAFSKKTPINLGIQIRHTYHL